MSVRNRQLQEILDSFSEEILKDKEKLAEELTQLSQKHPMRLANNSCNKCYGRGYLGSLLLQTNGKKTITENDYANKRLRRQKITCKCVYKGLQKCLELKHPKTS